MSRRVKKRKKVFTQYLSNGYKLKMRLLPLLHTSNGCVWVVSLAVSKSKRQINDWMNRRHNKRTRLLGAFLTGKEGNKIQAIAVRQLRKWMNEHPLGHSISFRCESAKQQKQFDVWSRWFQKDNLHSWEINKELKSFFFYKSSV